MNTPIHRQASRPPAGLPTTTGTKPADAAPVAEAPATTQAAPSSAGLAAAPTSYTQAKGGSSTNGLQRQAPARPQASRGGMTLGKTAAPKEAASPLVKTELASLAKTESEAPAKAESAVSAKADYPVKWQAEEALKQLKADPRVKGEVQMDLGRMIGSPGFKALGPKGQVQAFELFKANMDDPAARKRVREGVNMLDCIASKQGKLDVLEGLTKASPLAAETLAATKDLVHSKGFLRLKPKEQDLVAEALKENKCDPKYSESLKKLLEDPKFKGLKSEERTKILQRAREFPDARTVELFRANVGDKAALGRAHEALDSLGSVKSAEGKMQVAEALTKASPMQADTLAQTKALLGSPQFAALSDAHQRVLTEGMNNHKAHPHYVGKLQELIESPKLAALTPTGQSQAMELLNANLADPTAPHMITEILGKLDSIKSAGGKADVLGGLAKGAPLANRDVVIKLDSLLASPQFSALSASDQRLLTGAIEGGKADPKLLANTLDLLQNPSFQALGASDKTAVLSQVNNYPDPRSVENMTRLVQKDWFGGFDAGDKQRALKVVAYLSQHPGDRLIINNTLDKFLAPAAPYKFDFTATGTGYGSASTDGTFHFNPTHLASGNGKVNTANDDTFHMVTHTVAHEVNHLANNYPPTVEKSHSYFMDEYRAFYVGFMAQNGREPTRAEVLDRVQFLLTATADQSQAYDHIRRALQDPVEGPKMVAFMNKVLGRNDVTQANAGTLGFQNPADGTQPAPTPEKSADRDPNNLTNS